MNELLNKEHLTKEEINSLNLEDTLTKLESLANLMNQGNNSLEAMMQLYQEGAMLSNHAGDLLKAAEAQIEMLGKQFTDENE